MQGFTAAEVVELVKFFSGRIGTADLRTVEDALWKNVKQNDTDPTERRSAFPRMVTS
jgi:hypothetical protein